MYVNKLCFVFSRRVTFVIVNKYSTKMSMASGKKKVTQDDLRRIMSEQKKKLLATVKKIDSPLAKYPFV